MAKSGAAGRWRDQCRGAASFANQHSLIAVKPVFMDEIIDDRNDLVGGDIKDGTCGILDRFADVFGERSDSALSRLRIAEGVQSGPGVSEDVGGAGIGDGIAGAGG